MKTTISYIRQSGRKNNLKGIACQDYASGFYDEERGLSVVAVADGAGNYKHSAAGAEAAVEAVLKYFRTHETIEDQEDFVHRISDAVEETDPVNVDVGTTLLFVAATQTDYVAGHIGDGVILMRKNSGFSVLSLPENGEYLWETFLLPCSESSHRFRFYQGRDAEGFLLTSDGLSALLYEEDGQGAPACEKLYQWSKQMTEKDFQKITLEHFDDIFAKYSDDDKSLAIIRLDGTT